MRPEEAVHVGDDRWVGLLGGDEVNSHFQCLNLRGVSVLQAGCMHTGLPEVSDRMLSYIARVLCLCVLCVQGRSWIPRGFLQ